MRLTQNLDFLGFLQIRKGGTFLCFSRKSLLFYFFELCEMYTAHLFEKVAFEKNNCGLLQSPPTYLIILKKDLFNYFLPGKTKIKTFF